MVKSALGVRCTLGSQYVCPEARWLINVPLFIIRRPAECRIACCDFFRILLLHPQSSCRHSVKKDIKNLLLMLHTFRWFSIPFLKTQKSAGPSNREQLVSRRTQLTPWLDRKLAIASIPCIRIECYPARILELTQHLD